MRHFAVTRCALRCLVLGLVWVSGLAPERATAASEAAAESSPREWQVSDDLRITSLARGVWLHTSWQVLESGHRFPSNGLLVREGDHLVLVDTAWGAELTRQLVGWIDETLGLPIDRAVVTHFHDDRLGGTPELAERGIPFLGSKLTRELGRDAGVPLPEPLVDLERGKPAAFGSLEVFYPGPGHTRDNVVVWLPEERILFGGCAVRPGASRTLGNTADAVVEEWANSIRRVQERYGRAEMVVPSHGPPAGPELLAHTIAIAEDQLAEGL